MQQVLRQLGGGVVLAAVLAVVALPGRCGCRGRIRHVRQSRGRETRDGRAAGAVHPSPIREDCHRGLADFDSGERGHEEGKPRGS